MVENGCKILGEITYEIRYGVFPARDIFNLLGPGSKANQPALDDPEQERRVQEKRADANIKRRNKLDGFYEKLEESILRDGIRNPIATVTGKVGEKLYKRLPFIMQMDPDKIWACNFQGGSRLYIAQKHKLDIPCFIADYVGRFKDLELTSTANSILSKFRDKPTEIRLYEWGIYFHNLPHIHMKNK